VAYKANIDDLRESPARHHPAAHAQGVREYHDPVAASRKTGERSRVTTAELLSAVDVR
jgi:UDP-N-acetyl-D-mannosaminuronate dehydrogenase